MPWTLKTVEKNAAAGDIIVIPPLTASTTAATMLAWLKTNFAADYVDLF